MLNSTIRAALREWVWRAHYFKDTRQWHHYRQLLTTIRLWFRRRHWTAERLRVHLGVPAE